MSNIIFVNIGISHMKQNQMNAWSTKQTAISNTIVFNVCYFYSSGST